ncbi:MAG: NADH-quinone oxidoreductase subunit C [Prevotellaceae bacterium]|jgi:NADH-quinone oxidoreductase subunit C/D|nr:NADH-quinone oxidoreductase subunit C [Prevotellaceae bacterium]
MNNIKQLILSIAPAAVFAEGAELTVSLAPKEVVLAPKEVVPVLKALKESAETFLDFLVAMVGMDSGETLGVIYYLSSSANPALQIAMAKRGKKLVSY